MLRRNAKPRCNAVFDRPTRCCIAWYVGLYTALQAVWAVTTLTP